MLLEFEVSHAAECHIDVVQGEGIKVRRLLAREVLVVHEHLPHFVAWRCCVHRDLQPQASDKIWQGSKVLWVWM